MGVAVYFCIIKVYNGFVDRYGFLCSFICFCKMVAFFYSTVMVPSLPTFSFPFFAGLGVFSIFMKLGKVWVFLCLPVFCFFVYFASFKSMFRKDLQTFFPQSLYYPLI